MEDYLNATSFAVGPLFRAISEIKEPLAELERDLLHLELLLEELLEGEAAPKEWRIQLYKKNWGDEATPENVRAWSQWLEENIEARKSSRTVMCASILLIAQNGIKKVLGSPREWSQHKGTALTKTDDCILQAIWHGRNQAAHVEGLTPGKADEIYFRMLEQEYGPMFSLETNSEFISEAILKNVLGWIDWSTSELFVEGWDGKMPYARDMLRLGALVGK